MLFLWCYTRLVGSEELTDMTLLVNNLKLKAMKKIFIVVVMLLSLLMSACIDFTKIKEKVTGTEEPQKENAVVGESGLKGEDATETSETAKAEDDASTKEEIISQIKKAWRNKSISVVSNSGAPGIKDFAKAFCLVYPDYAPNKCLLEYVNNPSGYVRGDGKSAITDKSSNGYLKSDFEYQYGWLTECCYWKRNNGHRLVAFWLAESHESGWEDCVVAFYDYDPQTGVMTPETSLCDMIEKEVKRFQTYNLRLPIEGKDIEIYAVSYDNDENMTDEGNYKLVWNGQTFKMNIEH